MNWWTKLQYWRDQLFVWSMLHSYDYKQKSPPHDVLDTWCCQKCQIRGFVVMVAPSIDGVLRNLFVAKAGIIPSSNHFYAVIVAIAFFHSYQIHGMTIIFCIQMMPTECTGRSNCKKKSNDNCNMQWVFYSTGKSQHYAEA